MIKRFGYILLVFWTLFIGISFIWNYLHKQNEMHYATKIAARAQFSQECSSIEKLDGKTYLRLMRPLTTEKSCLKCHSQHGYEEGDIRGGISMAVLMSPYLTTLQKNVIIAGFWYCFLWLLGLIGIWFGCWQITNSHNQLLNEVHERNMIWQNIEKVNENLAIEHNKLQGVVNGIGNSVYIVNKNYIIEFQNNNSKKLFGELTGKKCFKSFFGYEEPCNFCMVSKTLKENCILSNETTLVNEKSYDITFSPFKETDENFKIIVIARDITEKKSIQTEAMRISHLASLGELAAGVAHEINNPITGIISIAEIIADKFHYLGEDRKIPERIISEGERIGVIVKKLLSFARNTNEDYTSVSIGDVLESTLILMKKQIFQDGISLSIDLHPNLPKIKARSYEIQQVIMNILSNARYALNKKYDGFHNDKILDISVILKEIIINDKKTQYIRLTFYDEGLGIPNKFLKQISDPFFSTKPKGEGTGLGLSISHGIIENHNGKLWFESEENSYTKVYIDLPVDNEG